MNKSNGQGFTTQERFSIWRNWLLLSLLIRFVDLISLLLLPSSLKQLLLGVFVGWLIPTLQWNVIKNLVTARSRSWVIATWLGYMLSLALSRSAFVPLERALNLRPGFTEYDQIVVLFYLFWLIEALCLGTSQAFLLSKWSKLGWTWLFVLTFSMALEFSLIQSTGALASLLSKPSLFGFLVTGFAMLLTSSLTGIGLLRLLKTPTKPPTLAIE